LWFVDVNLDRFPEDFMFQLTWEETNTLLRSQIVTLKRGQHRKYRPYVFTEQGVAMLSSVPRSKRAVQVNVAIMRAFVKLRMLLATHRDLARKLAGEKIRCAVSRRFWCDPQADGTPSITSPSANGLLTLAGAA
jgi:hypothetical protein